MSGLTKAISFIIIVFLLFVSVPAMVFSESNQTGAVAVEVLNLRQNPTVSSKILCQLSRGMEVQITDKSEDWDKVIVSVENKEITGWVMAQYISIDSGKVQGAANQNASTQEDSITQEDSKQKDVTGQISIDKISVLGADKLNQINKGTINVLSESKIYAISTSKIYAINANTIRVISVNTDNAAPNGLNQANVNAADTGTASLNQANASAADAGTAGLSLANANVADAGTTGSSLGITSQKVDELIRFARALLGSPYVYGGMSPDGFDCSGFTSYVFGAFGVKLERVSSDQAKQGIEVAKENLKPGDLVFFDTSGGHSEINHTGIYIGDGKFIHASSGSSARCVIISDITAGYYANNYITARSLSVPMTTDALR